MVEDTRGKNGKYKVHLDHAMYGSINGGGPEMQFTRAGSFTVDWHITDRRVLQDDPPDILGDAGAGEDATGPDRDLVAQAILMDGRVPLEAEIIKRCARAELDWQMQDQ